MKKIIKIFSVVLVLFVYVMGCTKDPNQGMPGPRGEQGPAGTEVGPRGPVGDPGDAGGSVAGVISSEWIQGTASMIDYDYGTGYVRTRLNAPELTKAVLDSGIAVVYFKKKSSVKVFKLEYYTDSVEASQLIYPGIIRIYTNMYDKTTISNYSFRYVVIPGAQYINARRSSPLPKLSNYEEVCKFYGIKE